MGYEHPENFDKIESIDDIYNFVVSSKLFDVDLIKSEKLNTSMRKNERHRDVIGEVMKRLRESGIHSDIKDPDYFLEKYFPKIYKQYKDRAVEINTLATTQKKFDGKWAMSTFNVKPGPIIGKIMTMINRKFGKQLQSTSEGDVIDFVKSELKKTK